MLMHAKPMPSREENGGADLLKAGISSSPSQPLSGLSSPLSRIIILRTCRKDDTRAHHARTVSVGMCASPAPASLFVPTSMCENDDGRSPADFSLKPRWRRVFYRGQSAT